MSLGVCSEIKQVSAVHSIRLMEIQRDRITIYDLVSVPPIEQKTDAAILRTVTVHLFLTYLPHQLLPTMTQ